MKMALLAITLVICAGCNKATLKVTASEPTAIHELREKASQRKLKWNVFSNGDEYLAYATNGSMALDDCRDHWSAKGKTAEETASNLSKAVDGPPNVLMTTDKFTATLFGCNKRGEHYSSSDW